MSSLGVIGEKKTNKKTQVVIRKMISFMERWDILNPPLGKNVDFLRGKVNPFFQPLTLPIQNLTDLEHS